MSYVLSEHTADVAVKATSDALGGVFAAVADGLAAAQCESIPDHGGRFEVTVEAEGLEAALFDYLDELIYQRDVRDVLPVDNEAAVREEDGVWYVEATARGVPLSELTAREVKAVTYSEMTIKEIDGGWYAYVVLDV